MSDRDFEIGDMKFKLHRIDVFKQFHIARRLSPLMGEITEVAPQIQKMMGGSGKDMEHLSEGEKLEVIAKFAKPVLDGFSKLSDADANLVLLGLCASVEIYQPTTNSWARVAKPDALMFDALELPILLQIAARAFMYNVSSFFAIAPQTSHGGK